MGADTQQKVAALVEAGRPLEEIERTLIDPAGWLDDEERAALWLFAWAYRGTGVGERPGRPATPRA